MISHGHYICCMYYISLRFLRKTKQINNWATHLVLLYDALFIHLMYVIIHLIALTLFKRSPGFIFQ